jgi:predicted RecA/RadA family phage recombinase
MRNYIQPGVSLTLPSPGAVTSGDVVVENAVIGIAAHDAVDGEDLTIRIAGVFEFRRQRL